MTPNVQTVQDQSIVVQLLKPFSVSVGDTPMADSCWRLRHARHLFQMLCLKPGHRMHRDEALDCLWPQSDAQAAANRLHHTIHVLRTEFKKMGLAAEQPVVLFQGGTVFLNSHYVFSIDVWRFDALVNQSRLKDTDEAVAGWLEQAAALCEQLLPDAGPHAEWLAPHRAEIRDKCVWVLERLSASHRASGRNTEASQALQRLVGLEPCNEIAHRGLMELFNEAAQPDRALLQYSACKRYLQRDLGVEPSPATLALRDTIAAAAQQRGQDTSAPEGNGAGTRYVPAPPSCAQLLGRADELAQLQSWLGDPQCRLITIAASAGTGKTSLALTLAGAEQERFRDGVLVVRLTQLSDSSGLEQFVCQAAGLSLGHSEPAAVLREHLAGKQLLLVLDRFEHLVEAAPRVSAMLDAAPGLRVLTTSQCVLSCQAERVLSLRQLAQAAPAAAQALFVQTALQAGASPAPLSDLPRVARVCERLGGNALAIQLGAAQLATLSIEQLEAGIQQSLDLPLATLTSDEPQHHSLRAAIGWSVSLLAAPERAVLQGLAVFEGPFTPEDAHAVLGEVFGAAPTRRAMLVLVERCLLCRDTAPAAATSAPRLSLLDSIRQLLLAWSDSFAERQAVNAAHARLFRERTREAAVLSRSGQLASAISLYGTAEKDINMALDRQNKDVGRADYLHWCFESCLGQYNCGQLREAAARLQFAVALPTRSPEERRHSAWCCFLLARARHWADDLTGAVYMLRMARQRSRGLDETALAEKLGVFLGGFRGMQLHLRAAHLHVDELLRCEKHKQLSDSAASNYYMMSGSLLGLQGEYTKAMATAETQLDLALASSNPHFVRLAVVGILEFSVRQGRLDEARVCVQECEAMPGGIFAQLVHFMIFSLHFESADYAAAQASLRTAGEQALNANVARTTVLALAEEFILLETGRGAEVRTLLSANGSEFVSDFEFFYFYVQQHCYRLRLQAQRGAFADANLSLAKLLSKLRRSRNRLWVSWLAGALAGVAADRGDFVAARQLLWRAERLQRDAGIIPSPRQRTSWRRVRDLIELTPVAVDADAAERVEEPPSVLGVIDSLEVWAKKALAPAKNPQRSNGALWGLPRETVSL